MIGVFFRKETPLKIYFCQIWFDLNMALPALVGPIIGFCCVERTAPANQPQPKHRILVPKFVDVFFFRPSPVGVLQMMVFMVTMGNTSNPWLFQWYFLGSNSDHLGCGGFRAAFQVTWTAAPASVCHMRPVSGVQDIGDQGSWTCWNTPQILLEKVKKNTSCRKISIWTLTTGNHLSDAVLCLLRILDSLWNPCMTLGRW